jgi:catechol 2,3-dioxygenase-like lactoylglutathione lyase family enzyme
MRIKELILETADPAGLRTFYENILELPVAGNSERIVITTGSSQLVFKKAGTDQPFYHFAFTIPANAILKAKEWLQDKVKLIWIGDYKSEIADFVNWHAQSVYFFDPAGNIVELIARFDLANATQASFSSQQILSISKAGLVFEENELNERTNDILQQYQLSWFDKQSPLPQFRAVGNDEGLFIIVPANRNWYPTNKASGIFPMEIRFDNDGTMCKLSM